MPKISALPPAGTLADDDETPFVDDSAGSTKKFTLAGLIVWLQSKTAWITAAMIAGIDKSLLSTDVNPYKFSVYRNSAWTTGNSVQAKVSFDTEVFDSNNNFASGTYTAPLAGFYQFTASVQELSCAAGNIPIISVFKNGSEHKRGTEFVVGNVGNHTSQVSALVQCAANDTIEIYYRGSNKSGGSGALVTWMTGFLVSRT